MFVNECVSVWFVWHQESQLCQVRVSVSPQSPPQRPLSLSSLTCHLGISTTSFEKLVVEPVHPYWQKRDISPGNHKLIYATLEVLQSGSSE